MGELVSFVVATCNRRQLLVDTIESVLQQDYPDIEIVVVSNGSTDGTRDLFAEDAEYDDDRIRFYHYDDQLGVSEARNVGYRKANGDIIVTIDDDAIIENADATDEIIQAFAADERLGILSFKIVNYYTGKVGSEKIPTIRKGQPPDIPFESAYFLGGGNAIRAEVFETVGYYPSDFTYSFEELDLSYRTLDAGFKIMYVPSVVIIHNAEPKSSGVPHSVLQQYLTNRIKVALRNLPWRYVILSSIIWTCYTVYRADFDPRPALRSLHTILYERGDILTSRSVISSGTVNKIKNCGGRLWK